MYILLSDFLKAGLVAPPLSPHTFSFKAFITFYGNHLFCGPFVSWDCCNPYPEWCLARSWCPLVEWMNEWMNEWCWSVVFLSLSASSLNETLSLILRVVTQALNRSVVPGTLRPAVPGLLAPVLKEMCCERLVLTPWIRLSENVRFLKLQNQRNKYKSFFLLFPY